MNESQEPWAKEDTDTETVHSAWFHLLKFKNGQSLDDTNQNSGCPRGMGINGMGIERVVREFGGG